MLNKKLERILFYEIRNKQLAQLPNSDFFEAFKELDEDLKERYYLLSKEIHQIWTYINGPAIKNIFDNKINSIEEYHQKICPVSEEILHLAEWTNFTLEKEISQEFKEAFKKITGQDY